MDRVRDLALTVALIKNAKNSSCDIAVLSEKIISLWENQHTSFQQYNRNIEKLNRILTDSRILSLVKPLGVALIKLRDAQLQSRVESLLKKLPEAAQGNDLELRVDKYKASIKALLLNYNPLRRFSIKPLTPEQKERCSKAIEILLSMQDILNKEALTHIQILFSYGVLILFVPYVLILMALMILKNVIARLAQAMKILKEAFFDKTSHLKQKFWSMNTCCISVVRNSKNLEEIRSAIA